ncbi:HVA22-like protein [Drosera capensis]
MPSVLLPWFFGPTIGLYHISAVIACCESCLSLDSPLVIRQAASTCWLVIPYFSGAAYVYEHFIRPVFVNPHILTVNIWYVPRKKDLFGKRDDILTAAEKYIKEHGTDAFKDIINKADR